MKYLTRLSIMAVLIAVLAVGPALTVFAQDDGVFCDGLSEADCQILKDSAAAMENIQSFNLSAWSMNLNLEAGEESMLLEGSGSAVMLLPPGLVAMISDLPPVANMADLGPVLSLLGRLDATFIERLLKEMVMQLTIDKLVIDSPDESMALGMDLLIKDSVLYLGSSAPNGAEAWFGQSLEMTAGDLDELNQTLDDLQLELEEGEIAGLMSQLGEMTGPFEELTALMNQYVVLTREADQSLHGQDMIVFSTEFDLHGFLNAPELPALIVEMVSSEALEGLDLEDLEDLNETQAEFLLMTLNLLLKDSTFRMEQWIGADDLYTHKAAGEMRMQIDLALLGDEAEVEEVLLDASFAVELADINAVTPDAVTPPVEYFDMDSSGDFLAGDPSLIIDALAVGVPVTGEFDDSTDQHIYSLDLTAGDTIEVLIETDGYPYVSLYGPDGFLVEEYDAYFDEPLAYTAREGGMYLVVVDGYWDMEYELTVNMAQ
ncbi:MAG: hypothetical protein JXJ20_02150 [Anaerolineae bacterium]|nr:hypothetical protein [Anaerolineae bacterium]